MKKIALFCFAFVGVGVFAETPDSFIDHVQNDGTQYFDTGVIGKSYTKAEIDFTAEDLDLAGRPRVREGKVDVGCYECWLNSKGMFMSIK